MQSISYTLLNPTGNMTILAETPVPQAAQPSVAAHLMKLEPAAEQVGFLSFPDPAEDIDVVLRMAGGEFCGNAAMSAAALYLERKEAAGSSGQPQPAARTAPAAVTVRVSGTENPVSVKLTALDAGKGWKGTVTMPEPISVKQEHLANGMELPVVRFPGITHVILEEGAACAAESGITAENAEQMAPVLCAELGAEALGLMFLNRDHSALTPLVYVPGAGTLFWETSCASGTTAVGAWAAGQNGSPEASGFPLTLSLKQPGGTLEITAAQDGTLSLTGTVSVMYSGRG